jgi:acetylornithine/N-succinyldiaminopimelate aminotransferase
MGLLQALELGRPDGAEIVKAAFDRKLLINSPRPSSLRFMPALNVTREEIDQMVRTLSDCLS